MSYLRHDVRQQEGVVHGLLAVLVVPRGRHVTPGPARVPVVVVGCAHQGGEAGVGTEFGVAAVCQSLEKENNTYAIFLSALQYP